MTALEERLTFNVNPREHCRAGGYREDEPLHPNYGYPCLTGYIAEIDMIITNCIFCGRRFYETHGNETKR